MLSGADGIVFKNMDETIEEMRRLWQSKESLSAIAVKSILHSIIFNAARDIYQDYPELLKVIEEAFK